MSTPGHTPLPWKLESEGQSSRVIGPLSISVAWCGQSSIWSIDGNYSISSKEAKSNAAFIVRAVNSHTALVEAVKGLLPEVTGYMESMDWRLYHEAVKQARAVLASVEESQP